MKFKGYNYLNLCFQHSNFIFLNLSQVAFKIHLFLSLKFIINLNFTSYKFKNKSSYHVGSKYGLQLILNLTDIDCIDCDFDGIEVVIHDNTIDPMYYLGSTNNGFNIGILYMYYNI